MDGARPPKASAIQSLVAAWYQLWKWQKWIRIGPVAGQWSAGRCMLRINLFAGR